MKKAQDDEHVMSELFVQEESLHFWAPYAVRMHTKRVIDIKTDAQTS